MKNLIRLDVDRTHQKLQLFQSEENKETLQSTLFVWSMNHKIGYKQGMNEIAAIILYVGLTESETVDGICSWEHLEPDLYWLFDKIMQLGQEDLFNQVIGQEPDAFSEVVRVDKSSSGEASAVLRRCHYIHHRILQAVDSKLYKQLQRNNIESQLYLIRWLRCMFSREFSILDTIKVWDAVFATRGEMQELKLLNYFSVALLVAKREQCKLYLVLSADSSMLLEILVKPFEEVSVEKLIPCAMRYLKDSPEVLPSSPTRKTQRRTGLEKFIESFGEKFVPKKQKQKSFEKMLNLVNQTKTLVFSQVSHKEFNLTSTKEAIDLLYSLQSMLTKND